MTVRDDPDVGPEADDPTAQPTQPTIAFLLRQADRRRVALLLALMAGVSLTEGFGVLTLLPLLGGLQNGSGQPPWSARIGAVLGFEPSMVMLLVFITALGVMRAMLVYGRQVVSIAIQNQVVDRLRVRAFEAVLHAEWRWLVQTRGSDHANLILTNVARVGIGLNQMLGAGALAITVAAYFAAALLLSWPVALVAAAIGAVVLAMFATQRARGERFGKAIGEAGKATHAYVHQTLAGVRVVKAYGVENRQVAGFAAAITDLQDQALRNERMNGRGQALLQIGSAAALALVLGIGHLGFGVALPTLLPLLLAFARGAPMLGGMQSNWSVWAHMRPAVGEMQRFLSQASAAREPDPRAVVSPTLRRAIRLEGIKVSYAGRDAPALDGVSLTLPVNSTTALCGASGAGKSTLADVLMGLIAPDGGQLLVDDLPVEGSARIAWRRAIAYVQQDAFLFHDTICANILLGRAYDRAAIEDALQRAGAGFVLALPDGLETMVGDGGARLSGGERQRIALARALIGAPALLILDEATSALDPEHEMAVRRTLRALRGQVTLLFITHREAMRADADQIVMLEHGRVV